MSDPLPRRHDPAAMSCGDLPRSIEWYSSVHGLEFACLDSTGTCFDLGETIHGPRRSQIQAEGPHERGVVSEAHIPGKRFFDIAGPDDENLELVERPDIVVSSSTWRPPARLPACPATTPSGGPPASPRR